MLVDKQVNLTFGQATAQNQPSDDLYPAWSPNGEAIAFTSNRSGHYEIWLMNVDGSGRRPLTTLKSTSMTPTWYPNSLSIAFVSRKAGSFDIWRTNLDGGGLRNLTYFLKNSDEKDPSWSPDGNRIVFSSNLDGAYKLYTIDSRSFDENLKDANITIVQDQQGNNYQPVWSPDGTKLAFVSDRGGRRNIWIMPFPGDRAIKLTSGQDDAFPSWSLDGREVFYSSREGNTTTLFAVQATGGTPRKLLSWPGYNSFDPEWSRKPEITKILFTSNRDGNNDIWLSNIRDTDAPYLLKLPVVSPRQGTRPGDKVFITAKVEDRDSGVDKVYAQIKNADKFIYVDQNEKIVGAGTKSGGGGGAPSGEGGEGGGATDAPPVRVRVHVDYEMVDTIELFDDGKHNDGQAGDGIYANIISTKGGPSDYYVNIVVKDKSGNTKFYDNITGFTTKVFVPANKILLVNDYMCGQRFDAVRYGGGYNRPGWLMNPTEEYYKSSWSYATTRAIAWSGYVWSKNWWLEGASGSTGIMRKGNIPRDPFYGEPYDEWRIICRGPLDAATLLTYSNSDKCVIWASPYSGNLWVDAGTIIDVKTQNMLMRFLDYGGRLMLSGQDIAWALTKDGREDNKFLSEYVKVKYMTDQSGSWFLNATPDSIADLPSQGDTGTGGGAAKESASKSETAPGGEGGGGGFQIKLAGYYYQTKGEPPDPNYWAGDACKNQWWQDVVLPVPPAEAILTYGTLSQGEGGNAAAGAESAEPGAEGDDGAQGPERPKLMANAAGVCYWNTKKNYKVVFLAFGFEGIRPSFEEYKDPETNKQGGGGGGGGDSMVVEYATLNNRARLMGSIITWLRTGRITGVVTDGVKPLKDAVVEVYLGPDDTKPIYKTTTLSDGSYTILGIDSGHYSYVKAKYPGFYDHVIGCNVVGGRQSSIDFKLATITKGLVYGRVIMPDGVTPVSRALVEVIYTNPITREESVIRVAYTEFDGRYKLGDLKGSVYKIRASAPGLVTLVKGNVPVEDEKETLVNFKMSKE